MDSCIAKLTDEHLAELNKLQGQLGMSWIERTRLESRIAKLEAALVFVHAGPPLNAISPEGWALMRDWIYGVVDRAALVLFGTEEEEP